MERCIDPRIRHWRPGDRSTTSDHDLNEKRHERFQHVNGRHQASTVAQRVSGGTSMNDLIPEHQQPREHLVQNHLNVPFTGRRFNIRNGLAGASPIGSFASPVIVPEERIRGQAADSALDSEDRVLEVKATPNPDNNRDERLEVQLLPAVRAPTFVVPLPIQGVQRDPHIDEARGRARWGRQRLVHPGERPAYSVTQRLMLKCWLSGKLRPEVTAKRFKQGRIHCRQLAAKKALNCAMISRTADGLSNRLKY